MDALREFKIAVLSRRVASRFMTAMEFNTPEALKEYLKEHPNADKSLHTVKKPEKDESKKDESGKAEGEKGGTLYKKVDVPKAEKPPRKPAGKGKPPAKPKEAARVGVPGMSVPPPPKELPRLKNLTPDEELVQNSMCEIFESNPDEAAKQFSEKIASKDNWVFETDAAKSLLPGWQRPDLPKDPKGTVGAERADFRGRYNAVMHQAANAIVKRAFVNRLDEIAKMPEGDRKVLVTSGGVASGKGMALGAAPALKEGVAATWDAAGEQNSTENEWIMKECEARGIKPTFLFVAADPIRTWNGVIARAKGQGRMVDAQLFADSYATGAKNFKDFYEKNKGKANFAFGSLEKDEKGAPYREQEKDDKGNPKVDADGKPVYKVDDQGRPVMKPPRMSDTFPEEALKYSTEDIYAAASKALDEAYDKGEIGEHIYQGGSAGRRFFQE